MKSPWDKDPGTVIIHNEEVTEHWSAEEHLAKQKEAAAKKTQTPPVQPSKAPVLPKSSAAPKSAAPSGTPASAEDVGRAIDETLGKIGSQKEEEFTGSLSAADFTTAKGADLREILLTTTKLTREQLDEALAAERDAANTEMIGDILVRKKLITEDDLLNALSLQLGIPVDRQLTVEEVAQELIAKVPINFAKKHGIVPLKKHRNTAYVAVSNPLDLSPIDDLRILLQMDVKPILAKKSQVLDVINRIYDRQTKAHEDLMEDLEEQGFDSMALPETQDLLDSEDEAPIIRLVNTLLFRAVKDRASDIHIEPYEKELSVRFRIDGVLYEIMKPPKRAQASISSRVKIMAQLDIAEKRVPQDGRIKIKIAGRDVDIRVSTLPTSFGESIVMRLLDTSHVILSLEDLGFSQEQLQRVQQVISQPHGIFLVTGPTGSGKTTTLYACLSRVNSSEVKIITVEDPVEIQLTGIAQIQVHDKVGLSFAEGLRSILRQDPDIIMVGEIRDLETADIAIRASLTGHLVFSTLHTNDAIGSVTRLINMGVPPYLVSSSLTAVMAQRLVRVVCKECREAYSPSPQELKDLNINPEVARKATIFRARGCPNCFNTGYRGRSGIYEILVVDDQFKNLIVGGADDTTLKKNANARGMKTLRADGAQKVLQGVTTIEEVLGATQDELTLS
ncbi:MAG TPA: type II secretion system ATPase GspE [Bdellovibrionota bacterium]|nr:type II secretion system ATPase GspE [Bdellovibrionota bacterium]